MANPADQQRYGDPGFHPEDDPHPPMKTDRLEREEQRLFASECLRKGYAIIWHSTAHRSKASVGCPDFALTVNGYSLGIEFKRDYSCKLSPDQENWRDRHVRNGGHYFVVYSCAEAIAVLKKYEPPI